MLPSLTVQLPHATLDDTGLKRQWQLLQNLRTNGQQTIVLDSRELLLDPEAVLRQLCDKLDLTFEQGMLSWPRGRAKRRRYLGKALVSGCSQEHRVFRLSGQDAFSGRARDTSG